MMMHRPPARSPVTLERRSADVARPPDRPSRNHHPETEAPNFVSLNPSIGTPLPIAGRLTEAVIEEAQAG